MTRNERTELKVIAEQLGEVRATGPLLAELGLILQFINALLKGEEASCER